MEKNSIHPIASPYAATLSCSHCLYALDYPGHDVELACYGIFVAVEDNLGGLVFELVDEHACGFHVSSPLGCGVAFASYVVVTCMTNLMSEYAPALDWCEPVADEDTVVGRVVTAFEVRG